MRILRRYDTAPPGAAPAPHRPSAGLGPVRVRADGLPHERRQPWRVALVVPGEPRVGDVHLAQAAVDLVAAVVEPPGDVLAVLLGQVHRTRAVRRDARGERLG